MNWDLALRSCSVVFERLLGFWANERKKVKSLSHVQHFATPWTVAHQASPSMEFSRQEYWSGLLFPSPGDLPDPGIEPGSPTLQADAFLYKMWWELADSIITLFCIFFFFAVFIEFVTILLLSYVLACWPQSTWDLSSPTRGWTWTPCIGRQSLNHWATREVPIPCIFMHQLIEMGRFWPHVLCL